MAWSPSPSLGMRSDNILTSLGSRNHGSRRLWVEDSFCRLTNNGFAPGSPFSVEPRQGPGVNLRAGLLGSYIVSRRRGAAILSYENVALAERFSEPEVRVKISVNLVQVLPSLRVFSVRRRSDESWSIGVDGVLTTPEGKTALITGRERTSGRPDSIAVVMTANNLVAATDFIARVKPRIVTVTVDSPVSMDGQTELFTPEPIDSVESAILKEVSRQFFTSCGWTDTGSGRFER